MPEDPEPDDEEMNDNQVIDQMEDVSEEETHSFQDPNEVHNSYRYTEKDQEAYDFHMKKLEGQKPDPDDTDWEDPGPKNYMGTWSQHFRKGQDEGKKEKWDKLF